MASLLIIVPTYNERENVERAAVEFQAHCDDCDLLFVDDNSPDGTGDLLDEIALEMDNVFVLHRQNKEGLGPAYIAGFHWALEKDYQWIMEMDCDFSHDPKYVPQLLDAAKRSDVAIGSRYIGGGGTENWGLGRRILSRGGGVYARTILGTSVKDMTSGFVCYNRHVLEELDLTGVQTSGYGFQIEMKYRCVQKGFSIEEIPIVFCDRRVGQSKMTSQIALEAMAIVWKLRFGR